MNNNHSSNPDDKKPQDKSANDPVVDVLVADPPSDQSGERAAGEAESSAESTPT